MAGSPEPLGSVSTRLDGEATGGGREDEDPDAEVAVKVVSGIVESLSGGGLDAEAEAEGPVKDAGAISAPSASSSSSSSPAVAWSTNFALAAPRASSVTLCVFDRTGASVWEGALSERSAEGVWHGELEGCPPGMLYGFKVDGFPAKDLRWHPDLVLLDPYAKAVFGRRRFGVRDEFEAFSSPRGSRFLGVAGVEALEAVDPYDWRDDDAVRPRGHLRDLVIYEVPVRCFTASPSSGLSEDLRGTFAGLAAKAAHLSSLGVNCVELLPVFEYDELEFQRFPNPRDHMTNVWGYSHLGFFSPSSRLASGGRGPVAANREFKDMVRELHAHGIQVVLDVVYNHTAEGGDDAPYVLSWRGIDAGAYYQTDPDAGALLNWSGCGNTFNGNSPLGARMIVDSLRHWVSEYHVDGFRFDLAPCLCRDAHGHLLRDSTLMAAIAADRVLAPAHLISEPWDLGAYMVGAFPNDDPGSAWAEWNGKYRDDVRRFVRGDPGAKRSFATRVSGSADLFRSGGRQPAESINFVVCHDGFTLYDLVSYDRKRNWDNGESNRDGTDDNLSWSCGAEGDEAGPAVRAVRSRQAKNFMVALMVSQGTPMVLAGDETLQTRHGNNNWYGHDSPLTWFDWDLLGKAERDGWLDFFRGLVRFRRSHALLGRDDFLTPNDVTWHEDRWDDDNSRFLAWTLHDRGQGDGDLYVAFNAHDFSVDVLLPPAAPGERWYRVVDTNLPSPDDFVEHGVPGVQDRYSIQPRSAIVLLSKPSL